ncbi:glycosyltransferase [Candidatus Margulisiibacteriota bacterium]
MKVLVVGTEWWGDWVTSTADAFTRLDIETEVLHIEKHIDSLARKFFSYPKYREYVNNKNRQQLKNRVDSFNPQLILIFNQDLLDKDTAAYIRSRQIKTFQWLGDDPFHVDDIVHNLDLYDEISIWDPYFISPLELIANKKVHYLPAAGDDHIYKPLPDIKKDIDISFVGSALGPNKILRPQIMLNLFNELGPAVDNLKIEIYGDNNWKNSGDPRLAKCFKGRTADTAETNLINNRSHIVLNLHHPQNVEATNLRTFEVALSGSFQLANAKSEITNLYGELITTFNDIKGLADGIQNYLNNPKATEENINKVRDITLQNHTYVKRAETILDIIKTAL